MIPHNRPTLGKEEENAVRRVITSGNLSQGNEVKLFENEFCKFMGLPQNHAVALSSGTSSLFLALWTLNANEKTIEFPGYTCSALRNAVKMVGGKEKILDIANSTPNVDSNLFSKNETIRIIVHMYGIPTDISELPKLNEVYKTYFTTEPLPVREAVCVKSLPLGASIEMSLIASKD